jgi:transglutaminase-like putative cysteine protease
MSVFTVRHVSTYRYARPVRFGPHRLMMRPRDSHDVRLIDTKLTIAPAPASLRWIHDVFGNSVALATFDTAATELRFESEIRLEQFPSDALDAPVEEFARTYPFSYSSDEIPDLGRTTERHHPDPDHALDAWAKPFATAEGGGGPVETLAMLARMSQAIKDRFVYAARDAEGTQTPAETLAAGSGSCRDFALLMMEAVRSLGFAARFVSGYLYDPAVDGGGVGMIGAGATHAWVEIYLPGAGWVEFDPTNGLVGTRDLIRVAVVRDPAQAVPLAGSWTGAPSDFLGLTVDVTVRRDAAPTGPAPTPASAQAPAPVPAPVRIVATAATVDA